MKNNSPFYILSIDGGGIRGVFPAHILKCIHEKLGINIFDKFNLIAGTSTGSIIAAAVAKQIEPAQVVAMYKTHGEKIFKARIHKWLKPITSFLFSTYSKSHLEKVLIEILGETTLGECVKPLIIPATDIGNNSVHVFKSKYSGDFVRDGSVRLKDAVLASCSAPTYFDPETVGEYSLVDGGLWANNPSLAAVIDARYRLGIPLENIRILSLGTGESSKGYEITKKRLKGLIGGTKRKFFWGVLTGWKAAALVEFIMSVQAQSIHNYLQLLIPKENIMRINYRSDNDLPLDDCAAIDNIISRADKEFSYNSKDIQRFLI